MEVSESLQGSGGICTGFFLCVCVCVFFFKIQRPRLEIALLVSCSCAINELLCGILICKV
jgi:hypothetical protein